jgi:hypothetical protein
MPMVTPQKSRELMELARQILEQVGNHNSSIHSCALLLRALHKLGATDAYALKVTATAYNKAYQEFEKKYGRVRSDADLEACSRAGGASCTTRKEARQGELGGHLVVVVPRLMGGRDGVLDPSIAQLDWPSAGIELRPACFAADPRFLRGLGPMGGVINDVLVVYEADPKEDSYKRWEEKLGIDSETEDMLLLLQRPGQYMFPASEWDPLPLVDPPTRIPKLKPRMPMSADRTDMVQFVAVCERKTCRAAFLVSGGLGGTPGTTFEFPTHYAGPCPECWAHGVILAGKYVMTETSAIFTPSSDADRELFERVRSLLRVALDKEVSPEEFQREARAKAPEASWLWDKVPVLASRDEFIKWVMLFLTGVSAVSDITVAACTVYSTFHKPSPTQPIQQLALPPEIIELLKAKLSDNSPPPASAPDGGNK